MQAQICVFLSSSSQSFHIFSAIFHCKTWGSYFPLLSHKTFLHWAFSLISFINKIDNRNIMWGGCFYAASMKSGPPINQRQGKLPLGTAHSFNNSSLSTLDPWEKPQNSVIFKIILYYHLVTGQWDGNYFEIINLWSNMIS